SSVFEQGLILGLYDVDRARQMRHKGDPIAWTTWLRDQVGRNEALATDGGARLRFLVEPSASPLIGDLRARIMQKFPKAKFGPYSPVAAEGEAEGARMTFGRPLELRHDLESASVILALDSDFLGDGPQQVRLSKQFAAARAPGAGMNRLYVVEPSLTITGSMAD